MTTREFIESIIPVTKNDTVLQSLLIAQICLESQFGKKHFHNNYLGIKCHAGVKCLDAKTKEFVNGDYKSYRLAFAVYDSISDCISDYLSIMSRPRYKPVREAKDYMEATEQIRLCGYATSPTYTQSLRKIIEQYKLYELDEGMNYYSKLTPNIIYGESWSTKVIGGKEVKRQVPPAEKYLIDVIITAKDAQKIRDKLNEIYGSNPKIGYRNLSNEIMIIINSFWRTDEFQHYLYVTKQSTTDHSDHEEGTAIDLANPKGMNSLTFYWFIKNHCNTNFNWFKRYSWGVHCSRR